MDEYSLSNINQKIIDLFDISIIIFKKKDNDLCYFYGNEYFKTHHKDLIENGAKFKTIFPESTIDLKNIFKKLEENKTYEIYQNNIRFDIYCVDNQYYVFFIRVDLVKYQELQTDNTRILINNMNHSIRTPLNSITGIIGLLNDTELTDEQENYIGKIKESCFILINIITDLLDFFKLETRNLKLNLAPFDLEEAIQSCIYMIEKKANEKKIKIYSIIHPDINKNVVGDLPRIKQIIFNILDNAIKFTNKGYIKIEVLEEQQLIMKISDTGIGLTKKEVENLSHSFTNINLKYKKGQMGLGLLISKYLLDLMNGSIFVNSTLNKGCTFTISIPLSRIDIPKKQKKVLIYHSNLKKRLEIAKILMIKGITPITSSSFEEALFYTSQTDIDLAIINDKKLIDKLNTKILYLGNINKENTSMLYIIKNLDDLEKLKSIVLSILETPLVI